MKSQAATVLSGALDEILEQDFAAAAYQADAALVACVRRQTLVSVMGGAPNGFRSAVQPVRRDELAASRFQPQERPARHHLVEAVALEAHMAAGGGDIREQIPFALIGHGDGSGQHPTA